MLTTFEQRTLVFVAAFLLGGTLGTILVAAGAGIPPIPASEVCALYPRNLALGSTGEDVKLLQQFLNEKGFTVSPSGAGSPGMETTYFGPKTQTALQKFQTTNAVRPALGYFGPLTRAKFGELCATAAVPATPVASVPSIPTSTPPAATSSPLAIHPRSIVGVICFYKSPDRITAIKGTGVIINPEGYVLTAKHAVDPRWTRQAYDDTLTPDQKIFYETATLERCEVGLPETNAPLPSASEILSSNPGRAITQHFQYEAEPYFLPDRTGLSDKEFESADFAILKISDATPGCASVNQYCFEFNKFPYVTVSKTMPHGGTDTIVSYGYPGGETRVGAHYYDFYMRGAAGSIAYYLSGNQRFSNQPFNFAFRAQNIAVGRSGSPLFYNGRLIGILYGSLSDTESYNLTINAIRGILADHGQAWLLKED